MRVALGAQRRDVLGLVVGQGMRLTFVGVVIGLAAALALTHLLRALLFEVKPIDPPTFVAVSFLLIAVGGLAVGFPPTVPRGSIRSWR